VGGHRQVLGIRNALTHLMITKSDGLRGQTECLVEQADLS
jgi:hypothetical protein